VAVLVDACPLYAVADENDDEHETCVELLAELAGPLVVPVLVAAEVVQLLEARVGAEAEVRFVGALAAGELAVESVSAADWERIAELVWQYRDLPLGTVDASLVAAAERLGIVTVATLDRRHFSVVRPAHVAAFELLP
jgi:predicted nucleic acid-binding protein